MIGIYKITNLKNGKVYIGQSRQTEKRWQQHKTKAKFLEEEKWYNPLYLDMNSIGIDNFLFEVIEECTIEELNEKEEYWIKYYNSQEDGYNITSGGNCTGKLSSNDVKNIIKLLQEKLLSVDDIAALYDVSGVTIRAINRGEEFYNSNIQYTIRTYEDNVDIYILKNNKKRRYISYCIDCGKKITRGCTRCLSCHNKQKKLINNNVQRNKDGLNNHNRLRKVKDRPSKEELLELIKTKSFLEIGRMYGVSDNAIRKWCKSYNLPYKRKDIKKIL